MRTKTERLATSNEVKLVCIEHQLSDDIGTRVLYSMLDKYVDSGETYVNKEIRLAKRYDRPRYFLVNLYNDTSKRDTVVIKTRD